MNTTTTKPIFQSQYALAEFSPLPRNGQRCPVTGLSRSLIYALEREGHIRVVRAHRTGCMRGRAFLDVASVRKYFNR